MPSKIPSARATRPRRKKKPVSRPLGDETFLVRTVKGLRPREVEFCPACGGQGFVRQGRCNVCTGTGKSDTFFKSNP